MSNNTSSIKHQLWLEELLNTISHGIGAVAAIVGLVYLVIYGAYSQNDWALFSALFYGISLVSVYVSSTLYHGVTNLRLKRMLCIVDHACIFLLIAGTYTPILLMTIGGTFGWTFFGIQWGIALIGILIKIFYKEEFESFSVWLYAIMGWVAIFKIQTLYEVLPFNGFALIVAGGLSYTIGIIFFVLDRRLPFSHFIWHLFVIAGSLLHYLAIFFYIL